MEKDYAALIDRISEPGQTIAKRLLAAKLRPPVATPGIVAVTPEFVPRQLETEAKILAAFGWKADSCALADVFHPDGDVYRTVLTLVGEEKTLLAKSIWERQRNYDPAPFAGGLGGWRCPEALRDKNFGYRYFQGIVVNFLAGLITALADDFSLIDYLRSPTPDEVRNRRTVNGDPWLPALMAWRLDAAGQAPEVLAAAKQVFTEAFDWVKWQVVAAGLQKSGNKDAHALAFAEFLQSDLDSDTQNPFLNGVEYGSCAGLIYFLRSLRDSGVLTKSKVAAWLGGTLGVTYEVNHPEHPRANANRMQPEDLANALNLALDCLEREEFQRECLAGGDVKKVYAALWALGKRDLKLLQEAMERIRAAGTMPQKTAALFLLGQMPDRWLNVKTATRFLADPENAKDPVVTALAVACFRDWRGITLVEQPGFMPSPNMNKTPLTMAEVKSCYFVFKEAIQPLLRRKTPQSGGDIKGFMDFGVRQSVSASADDLWKMLSLCIDRRQAAFSTMADIPEAPGIEGWDNDIREDYRRWSQPYLNRG